MRWRSRSSSTEHSPTGRRRTSCGTSATSCDSCSVARRDLRCLEKGGLRIITTLDWDIQQKAEEVGRGGHARAASRQPRGGGQERSSPLRRLDGATCATRTSGTGRSRRIDYQTGEIIAYVGSANYYERRKVNKKMQPQFDVLSDGWRQPGSAFKPFTYATGIDDRTLTAATMLMDVTTDFGGGYTPTDFNGRERGPLRVRNALQFSLNIPAVKALAIVGEKKVFDKAQEFGMDFQRDRPTAGLAMALGTLEVHPLDLTQAYATMANGAERGPHVDPLGQERKRAERSSPSTRRPRASASSREQAAYVMTDILKGNTDPSVNRSGQSTASPPRTVSAAPPPSRPAPAMTPRTSTHTATSRRPRRRVGATVSMPSRSASGPATATRVLSRPCPTRSSRSMWPRPSGTTS